MPLFVIFAASLHPCTASTWKVFLRQLSKKNWNQTFCFTETIHAGFLQGKTGTQEGRKGSSRQGYKGTAPLVWYTCALQEKSSQPACLVMRKKRTREEEEVISLFETKAWKKEHHQQSQQKANIKSPELILLFEEVHFALEDRTGVSWLKYGLVIFSYPISSIHSIWMHFWMLVSFQKH